MMSQLRVTLSPRIALPFIILNVADVALTALALSLGSRELNYIYSALGSPILVVAIKMLMVGGVILALGLLRRTHLLIWLNIGMALVVVWNVAAVLSWSL
jgi:hypothetical protein